MNFRVMGGGCGGPDVAGGASTGPVPRATGGGAGAGFSLNRNRLRSGPTGFGRSPFSAFRCTSGAVMPLLRAPRPPGPPVLAGLDDAEGAGDVTSARYATTPSAMTRTASRSCLRRSVPILVQCVVGGQLECEGQR